LIKALDFIIIQVSQLSATKKYNMPNDNQSVLIILGFQETSNYDSESELSDDENKSDISVNTQENQAKNSSELIIKNIQKIIYNSLFDYWDHLSQICLIATLLDPRLKEMSFANEEIRNNAINECRHQLHQLMNIQSPTSNENTTSPSSKNLSSNNMFKNLIF
ncbi:1109_t:CDS:1, partial [Racocetra persica]